MSLIDNENNTDQVVRISLLWLVVGALVMIMLGVLGGVLANQIWPPPVVPLSSDQDQIITTVQEVTISPNKSRVDRVEAAERSIVGIGIKDAAPMSILAMGVVITNDGLVISSAKLPKADLVAIDFDGRQLPLRTAGRDKLFGLSYFRLQEGLLSPLDLNSQNVSVGQSLLWLGRSKLTFLPIVEDYQVREWILPPELGASGWQRMMRGTRINEASLNGSALVDEEGRLAGIITNSPAGLSLSGEHLLESVRRIANGQREVDPFADFGIKVHFALDTENFPGRRFVVEVVSVVPESRANGMDLRVKDKIIGFNGEELSWQRNFVSMMTEKEVQQLKVLRGAREIDLSNVSE